MASIIVSVALVLSGLIFMFGLYKSSAVVALLAIAGGYSYRWISTGEVLRTIMVEVGFLADLIVIVWYGANQFQEVFVQHSKNSDSSILKGKP